MCFFPLQTIVSKYGSQFRGNSQHDALEFLLWLLDRVHEDVNLASNNNNNKIQAPEQVGIPCDADNGSNCMLDQSLFNT